MDMAAELIEIQAARRPRRGTPTRRDTEWQREFEAEFPYQPTDDQVTAAVDIKADMQKKRPMDRLLCGDVGYGKTEMAMRAACQGHGVWEAGGRVGPHDGAGRAALPQLYRADGQLPVHHRVHQPVQVAQGAEGYAAAAGQRRGRSARRHPPADLQRREVS